MVPLDGSDRALAAIAPARRFARVDAAPLWLVTVAAPNTTDESEAILAAGLRAAADPAPDVTVLPDVDDASALTGFLRDHPATLMSYHAGTRTARTDVVRERGPRNRSRL